MELHYRYWIGILIALLIGAISVEWAQVPDLAELLSFGLGITSLVLAVIAIFQALFSNSSFAEVRGSVTAAAGQIASVLTVLEGVSARMSAQVDDIPPALGKISNQLAAMANMNSQVEPAVAATVDGEGKELSGSTYGMRVALYTAYIAATRRKPFDTEELFGPHGVIGHYVQGCLTSLGAAGFINLEFKGRIYSVESVDISNVSLAQITDELQDSPDPLWPSIKHSIDSYFSDAASSAPSVSPPAAS